MLTQKRLKELLEYDEATGLFVSRSTRGPCKAGAVTGCLNSSGYVTIGLESITYYAHRLAWLYVFGRMPQAIDHIDHDRANNRIDNLREVPHEDNVRNQSKRSDNSSGVTGVSYVAGRKKFFAYIQVDGKTLGLGRFTDFSAAVAARKEAEQLYGFHPNHGR